jgi:hypothetical protein
MEITNIAACFMYNCDVCAEGRRKNIAAGI